MNEYEALAYEIGVRQNINNINEEGWNIVVESLLKQVPKKPVIKDLDRGWNCEDIRCPVCNKRMRNKYKVNYCEKCGQAIDWE